MMGQIDDSVAFGHGTPLLCRGFRKRPLAGVLNDRTDAYLILPHLTGVFPKQKASRMPAKRAMFRGSLARCRGTLKKSRWLSLSTPCVKTGFVPKLLSRLGRNKSEGAGC